MNQHVAHLVAELIQHARDLVARHLGLQQQHQGLSIFLTHAVGHLSQRAPPVSAHAPSVSDTSRQTCTLAHRVSRNTTHIHYTRTMSRPDPRHRPACQGIDNTKIFFEPRLYTEALRVCDTCTVRAWCLDMVDPSRAYFDGVAGGHTWHDGDLKCKTCIETDDILANYLSKRPQRRPQQNELPYD